jgi:enoyl-CoA hydratase/carnithine racemase
VSRNSFSILVYFYINSFTIFKIIATEFHNAVKELDQDPDVRVILVRAEGKVFTAGLDMKWATTIFSDGNVNHRLKIGNLLTNATQKAPLLAQMRV